MNPTGMGDEVASAARAVFSTIPSNTPIPDASVDAIWKAISEAIVSHIQANATVTVTTGSSAGVYTVQ